MTHSSALGIGEVQDITAVPQTPPYVRGVINLRGNLIPVVDLRRKFNLPEVEYTQRTCIIVVQVEKDTRKMTMGIVWTVLLRC